MMIAKIIFYIVGIAIIFLWGLFAITSWRERKSRAFFLSLLLAILSYIAWFNIEEVFLPGPYLYFVPTILFFIVLLLFFLPLGKSRIMNIEPSAERIDERDTMFAREEYMAGTDKHIQYYQMHPELKQIDEKMRKLPQLMAPGAKYYDPIRSTYVDAIFKEIRDMTTKVDGPVNPIKTEFSADEFTKNIKQVTRHLGAIDVGIAAVDPRFVYSHVGRGPETWGEPIHISHSSVICFTVEMAYENVEMAPKLPITEETAKGYFDATVISLALARLIRDLGYSARAHISGSNYQIILPAAAYFAGLGEIGRHGYLISPTLGPRIRLGAVTTDMPLNLDKPISFGVQDFCDRCKRCADNCPSASIPHGQPKSVKGVTKWPLEVESCIIYWRNIGTDCGLCMRVCPFSHPPSLIHNLVRQGIKRSSFARALSLRGEDFFYGSRIPY
ncbi:MAG: reductive dehalogenase [Candidatus Zixiibacteriota bacterium]